MHREKAIICSLCGENFYTKANLNRHILTKHKDLAPVECPVCYKGFSRKDVMKKHMKDVHFRTAATVVKPVKDNFPCDFCKKQFTLENLQPLLLRKQLLLKMQLFSQRNFHSQKYLSQGKCT